MKSHAINKIFQYIKYLEFNTVIKQSLNTTTYNNITIAALDTIRFKYEIYIN